MPKVSVYIPTYNCAEYLSDAIESILNQTYQDFELIIIDDGSTDNTKEVLGKYKGKLRYVYKENGGIGSARNRGIKESTGEYIAQCDADDLWLPEKLEHQVAMLDQQPEYAVVYSDAFKFYDDPKNVDFTTFFSQKKPYAGNIFKPLYLYNFIPNPTVVVRRKCFEDLELFDEGKIEGVKSKWNINEDHEMWLRIASRYKIGFVDTPLARCRKRSTSVTGSNPEKSIHNAFRVLEKINQFSPDQVASIPLTKRKKYSRLYLLLGEIYFHQNKLHEARKCFMKSLKEFPFKKKALLLFLLTYSSYNLINKLKKVKQKLK